MDVFIEWKEHTAPDVFTLFAFVGVFHSLIQK